MWATEWDPWTYYKTEEEVQFGHKAASEVDKEPEEEEEDISCVDAVPEVPDNKWAQVPIKRARRFDNKRKVSIINFHKSCDRDEYCKDRNCGCIDEIAKYIKNDDISSVDKFINEVEDEKADHKGWERIRVQIDSGAVDTVGPKSAGRAFPINPTKASKAGKHYIAANGSIIKNHGERVIKGETENCIKVSMPMQVADVKRVLMSTHKMNETGLKVVLDGANSFFVEKRSGKSTPIKYEQGKYHFDIWAPAIKTTKASSTIRKSEDDMDTSEVDKNKGRKNNQFWILGTDNSDF